MDQVVERGAVEDDPVGDGVPEGEGDPHHPFVHEDETEREHEQRGEDGPAESSDHGSLAGPPSAVPGNRGPGHLGAEAVVSDGGRDPGGESSRFSRQEHDQRVVRPVKRLDPLAVVSESSFDGPRRRGLARPVDRGESDPLHPRRYRSAGD
ncbi:hypothetical protein [Natronorarus salvus]|uniref:hypothetical protein n=1 Tax=Natronorarus salvus TaxID=3117733 RepID=UPI002F25EFE6